MGFVEFFGVLLRTHLNNRDFISLKILTLHKFLEP